MLEAEKTICYMEYDGSKNLNPIGSKGRVLKEIMKVEPCPLRQRLRHA